MTARVHYRGAPVGTNVTASSPSAAADLRARQRPAHFQQAQNTHPFGTVTTYGAAAGAGMKPTPVISVMLRLA